MSFLGKIGEVALGAWRKNAYEAGVVLASLRLAVRPSSWTQPVRDVLARQILFTGFEATRFIALIAVAVGVSVVVQAQVLLTKVGQTGFLGPLLVAVIIRELGPLLTNFVVIGRSGAAIATELGNMRVQGDIRVIDAQGVDPFAYLIMPRVLGVMVSVFCLTVVFVLVALVVGFLAGNLLGSTASTPGRFFNSIMRALTLKDVFGFLAKTILPGLATGAICCIQGMHIRGAVTEVPQATTRGLVRSVGALFLISAAVSVVFYLKP